jgi:hypothetical protein
VSFLGAQLENSVLRKIKAKTPQKISGKNKKTAKLTKS